MMILLLKLIIWVSMPNDNGRIGDDKLIRWWWSNIDEKYNTAIILLAIIVTQHAFMNDDNDDWSVNRFERSQKI